MHMDFDKKQFEKLPPRVQTWLKRYFEREANVGADGLKSELLIKFIDKMLSSFFEDVPIEERREVNFEDYMVTVIFLAWLFIGRLDDADATCSVFSRFLWMLKQNEIDADN